MKFDGAIVGREWTAYSVTRNLFVYKISIQERGKDDYEWGRILRRKNRTEKKSHKEVLFMMCVVSKCLPEEGRIVRQPPLRTSNHVRVCVWPQLRAFIILFYLRRTLTNDKQVANIDLLS